MQRKTFVAALLATLAFSLAWTQAQAQVWPERPVKMVLSQPAGSGPDAVARLIGDRLAKLWGQAVVIENKPGGQNVIGASAVARSTPDGYTFYFATTAALVTNSYMFKQLPYDPQKDFVEIAPIATQPFVLVAGASSGIKSVPDLIAMAKAKPGQIKFGSAGTGSGTHFCAEKFRLAAGIDVVHVPFKGGPEANAAAIAGEIAYWFPPLAMALKNVKEGKLLTLGIASAKRSSALPDAPTMAEAGVSLEDANWFGVWAPAGISSGVKDKLAKDVATAVASPDVREQLTKLGAEPMNMIPAEFSRFVRGEMEAAARTAKAAGIKPQ